MLDTRLYDPDTNADAEPESEATAEFHQIAHPRMSEARDSRVIAETQRQVERLEKLGWYHSIELPDGTVIPGHQTIEQMRTRLRQFHIPDDLTGKRVLDIGAWDGWFSFEMEIVAALKLWSSRSTQRKTRACSKRKRSSDSRIDYQIGDICRLTAKDLGTFDIVLFFGVLYHLKHPLLALENVCGLCRDMACIESFVTDSTPDAIPALEFYETSELRGQLDNWCGPNIACHILAFHTHRRLRQSAIRKRSCRAAHVSAYRHWNTPEGNAPAAANPLCLENSTTHDHNFSSNSRRLHNLSTSRTPAHALKLRQRLFRNPEA